MEVLDVAREAQRYVAHTVINRGDDIDAKTRVFFESMQH
jgi:hypothetical protein